MNWRRRRLIKISQFTFGLLALGWVILQPEWGRVVSSLSTIPPAVVIAVVGLTLVGLLARFYTWQVLVTRLRPTGIVDMAKTDLAINFVNQLLPSRFSGRSAAPLIVRQFTGLDWSGSVAVTGIHTGVYAILYAAVALAGLVAGLKQFSPSLSILIGFSTILYLLAGVVIITSGVHMETLYRTAGRVPIPSKVYRWLPDVVDSLYDALPSFTEESSSDFRTLLAFSTVGWYAIGWTVALAVVPGLRFWLLLWGMGVDFSPPVLLPLYLVAAYSVTLLPLTPGGIGVTEATATLVFIALGVPSMIVVPVVLLDRFLGVYLPALMGWYPALDIDFNELTVE